MIHESVVQLRGNAVFPPHTGERVYMRAFTKRAGLPADLARWQGTVDAMLDGIETDGPIYLMVDQGLVRAGATHRREGVHVDGYWHPALYAHGGDSHGYTVPPGSDGREPAPTSSHDWAPNHERERKEQNTPPSGKIITPVPKQDDRDIPTTKSDIMFDSTGSEGIILATDVTGCRGFNGTWSGNPRAGGDCDHIDLSELRAIRLLEGRIYAGNVAMLHESLPVARDCLRTVVRLNVPGWSPQK